MMLCPEIGYDHAQMSIVASFKTDWKLAFCPWVSDFLVLVKGREPVASSI